MGSESRTLNEGSLWGPENPATSPAFTLHPRLRSLKCPTPDKPRVGSQTEGVIPLTPSPKTLDCPSLARCHFLYSLTAGGAWGGVVSGLTEDGLDRDTDKNIFIVEAMNTLTLLPVPTEKSGTQVVGPVQETLLGAAEPGLGAGTEVLQVVLIVGLHKALDSCGDPAGEKMSQLRPQLPPKLCLIHPFLPQTQEPGPPALMCTLTGTTAMSLWSLSPVDPSTPSPCPAPSSRNYLPALVGGLGMLQALLAGILGETGQPG